jgi:N,N-dimethylformamidase
VVGQEWDNSATFELGPGHLILASSTEHTLVPPLFGAVRADYHADLVLFFRGSGAVFSVSSMAWCGALSHNGYDNEIATITGNVLARFIDRSPFPPVPDAGGAA